MDTSSVGRKSKAARTSAALVSALLLTVVVVAPEAHAQARPKPPAREGNSAPAGQEYHIEVNTLPGCFFYGCTLPVRASNIRVTAGGVRVPVRVTQPESNPSAESAAVPVHLLVAFAPGIKRPADTELLARLKRVLAAGWLVSACRADGTFTGYAREAELRRALTEHANAPDQDAGLDTIASNIESLRVQPGYRVVLVDLDGRSDDKFVRWLASETDRLSPVYVSDGGQAQMPYSPSAKEGYGGAASPFAGAANKMERSYTGGVFHELKLAEAIRHALADTRYDYDVRFHAPAAMAADAPVKLTFLDPGTHLPYEFRTELYVVETRDVRGKTARQRTDVTGRLTTVEK
jgi:hypothetical protein